MGAHFAPRGVCARGGHVVSYRPKAWGLSLSVLLAGAGAAGAGSAAGAATAAGAAPAAAETPKKTKPAAAAGPAVAAEKPRGARHCVVGRAAASRCRGRRRCL